MLKRTDDGVNWKKAVKVLADAIDAYNQEHRYYRDGATFCDKCPAERICNEDSNSEEGRCRRVINKWARKSI